MSCMWMRPMGRLSPSTITRLVICHVSITSSALAARSSPRIVFGSRVATSPALRASIGGPLRWRRRRSPSPERSEEHTSELQSHHDLVCRLLLEKKNTNHHDTILLYAEPCATGPVDIID